MVLFWKVLRQDHWICLNHGLSTSAEALSTSGSSLSTTRQFLISKKAVQQVNFSLLDSLPYYFNASVSTGTICFLRDTTPDNVAVRLDNVTLNAAAARSASFPSASTIESL